MISDNDCIRLENPQARIADVLSNFHSPLSNTKYEVEYNVQDMILLHYNHGNG